jgi:hypothetical protein
MSAKTCENMFDKIISINNYCLELNFLSRGKLSRRQYLLYYFDENRSTFDVIKSDLFMIFVLEFPEKPERSHEQFPQKPDL